MAAKLSKNLQIGIGVGIVGIIILFSLLITKEKPLGIKEVIDTQLAKETSLTSKRKSQLRVQLALNDYQVKNDGKLPRNLTQLVPTYFDSIPQNPDTGKPWEYRVVNGMPRVGSSNSSNSNRKPSSGGNSKKATPDAAISEEETNALIASLEDSEDKEVFAYDSSGKRDPFAPFNAAPITEEDANKTELEKLSIGQLRLTAILDGFEEPRALVETNTGKGYTIKKGTKIGTNSGEVVEIVGDKVLILETLVDFTGEKKSKTIELRLLKK